MEEAEAAKIAGLQCILTVRPNNFPLSEACSFKTVHSFDDIK